MAEKESVVPFNSPQTESSTDRVAESMTAELEHFADDVRILTLPPHTLNIGLWRMEKTGKPICLDLTEGNASISAGVKMTEMIDGKKEYVIESEGEPFVSDPLKSIDSTQL